MIGVDIEFNLFVHRRIIEPDGTIDYKNGVIIGLDGSMYCHEIRTNKIFPSTTSMLSTIIKTLGDYLNDKRKYFRNNKIEIDMTSKFHPLGGHIHISYPDINSYDLKNYYHKMVSSYQKELMELHNRYSIHNMYKRKNSRYGKYQESLRYNYSYNTIEFRSIPAYYLIRNFDTCVMDVTDTINKLIRKCVS